MKKTKHTKGAFWIVDLLNYLLLAMAVFVIAYLTYKNVGPDWTMDIVVSVISQVAGVTAIAALMGGCLNYAMAKEGRKQAINRILSTISFLILFIMAAVVAMVLRSLF